jgi:hypothetical protein
MKIRPRLAYFKGYKKYINNQAKLIITLLYLKFLKISSEIRADIGYGARSRLHMPSSILAPYKTSMFFDPCLNMPLIFGYEQIASYGLSDFNFIKNINNLKVKEKIKFLLFQWQGFLQSKVSGSSLIIVN